MTHLTRFLYVLLSYFMCCYLSLNSFMGYYGGFCGLFYFSFALIWLFTNSLAFQFKNSSFTIIQLFDFLNFLWYFPTLIPWQQLKYLCFKLFWIASCSLTECFVYRVFGLSFPLVFLHFHFITSLHLIYFWYCIADGDDD